MHIVLSGYYGFHNVGDEAILFSIIQSLKNIEPTTQITVLSNDPESTQKTYGVNAVNRWSFREISGVLKQADGLISGGGSLLQDETGLKSIPYYTGIMRMAKWHRKPVFVFAQGMGPINKSLSKWITKKSLNKVDRITVRDEDSKSLLEQIGVSSQIAIVPDPVLSLDASMYKNDWIKENDVQKPLITVSVRDWPSEVPFKMQLASCLDQLVTDGNTVVFVPMHGKADADTSQEVAELMNEKSLIAPSDLPIEEKISIIGESELLIGMRLHSLIFAAITYTPFVALSYDPKIDSFANIFKLPVAGHVTKSNWSSESLYQQVTEILGNQSAQENIKERAQKLQKIAEETPKQAVELFSK